MINEHRQAAILFVLFLVALALFLVLSGRTGRMPILPLESEAQPGAAGSAPVLFEPRGAVPAGQPLNFRWQPAAWAVAYEVDVLDPETGLPVLSTRVGHPDWAAGGLAQQLGRGKEYAWRVAAVDAAGRRGAGARGFFRLE